MTTALSRGKEGFWGRTTRKPMLLFVFDGVLLFRFAERALDASLFQLPPRFTR